MKKYKVHLLAIGGTTVELESNSTNPEEIIKEAYKKASLSDVEASSWDFGFEEIEDEDGNYLEVENEENN